MTVRVRTQFLIVRSVMCISKLFGAIALSLYQQIVCFFSYGLNDSESVTIFNFAKGAINDGVIATLIDSLIGMM